MQKFDSGYISRMFMNHFVFSDHLREKWQLVVPVASSTFSVLLPCEVGWFSLNPTFTLCTEAIICMAKRWMPSCINKKCTATAAGQKLDGIKNLVPASIFLSSMSYYNPVFQDKRT
ncbi:hypothetical protein ACJX0J_016517 [Zea mays]